MAPLIKKCAILASARSLDQQKSDERCAMPIAAAACAWQNLETRPGNGSPCMRCDHSSLFSSPEKPSLELIQGL
ncbi:hypothetical protein F6X59_12160 [Pseudomonas sp. MN1F]|nr:hypothetical protein [Pseudomonas sp. MN1F]